MLVTKPTLLCTAIEQGGAIYWDTATGGQVAVGRSVVELLEWFRTPATIEAWRAAGATTPSVLFDSIEVDRLYTLGLLVDQHSLGTNQEMLEAGPGRSPGLFGSQSMPLPRAVLDDAVHAVVLGMPYDVGTTGRPGTRFGPSQLRAASQVLFRPRAPGDLAGMFDPVRQRRVLAGARVADAGDITADVHTRNGESMHALMRTVGAIAAAGKLPLVLGGDHSITLPAARGVLATRPALGILHFDAHADYGRPRTDDWQETCHHGNFLDWLVADERVTRLVQFGVRQLVHDEVAPHEKRVVWPGISSADADPQSVLETAPADVPYYVTIDVDCLDPTVMPSTGTPLPGGFSRDQVVHLLELLCGAREIVGLDIVEYLPDGNVLAGHVAAELLLRALDAALQPTVDRHNRSVDQ